MNILFTQETDWIQRNPAQQHHLAEMLSLRGNEIRVIDFPFLWRAQKKRKLISNREIFNNITKIHVNAQVQIIRPSIVQIALLDYVSLLYSHRKELLRQINEFHPDVIVGWGILNSYLAKNISRKNDVPFIYYWIDVLDRLIPIKAFGKFGKIVESRTLRQADRIITINERLSEYVIKLGAPKGRIKVIRAGIDNRRFNPSNYIEERKYVRKNFGISEKDTVLFFMGWLYNFSGLKEVCKKLLSSNNKDIKIMIVGEGDAYNELNDISKGVANIILTGKKPYDEIPSLIAASDLCMLPAYRD